VINLAWKLPLVIQGTCGRELLNTYEQERKAHAHDLVSWAVDMGHLMAHLAAKEAAELKGDPPPPSQKSTQTAGYGQGREQPPIRSGGILKDQISNKGITGYLLSQPEVKTLKGNLEKLDVLLGEGFSLISHKPLSLNEKSREILDRLKVRLVTTAELRPSSGQYPEALLAGEALLVRPDKIIFGHTTSLVSVDDLLSALADASALYSA